MKYMKDKKNLKICLVGSSGGHLTHLYMLKPFWKDKNRFWVTFDKEDARSLLDGEKMYPCYYPTNRSTGKICNQSKKIRESEFVLTSYLKRNILIDLKLMIPK